jgi:very-long-chain ceramide synthase
VVSGSVILTVAAVHLFFPLARPYTKQFFQLSYHEANGVYVQGIDDACFVLGWLVLLTGLRATIIAGVYQFTTQYRLIQGKARVRFAEQSWLLFYSGLSFSLGMVSNHIGIATQFHH